MRGLFFCVTVYISVFGVCLLRTAMLCLWKVIWVAMGVECGVGVIELCDSLYIGMLCLFVRYSNVGFMEGNWVVMGEECGRVILLCEVYISVFGVCLLGTAILFLWKVIGLLWECSFGDGLLNCVIVYISVCCVCLLCTAVLCLWKVIGLLWECSLGVFIVLCDRLYIGNLCVFMYSSFLFMEGNWVVMGVQYEGVYCTV